MTPKIILTAALLLPALAAGAAAQTTQPAATQPAAPAASAAVTVAVFDFAADAPAGGEVGGQVAEVLTALLSVEPELRLVDRASLDKAVGELELGASGLVGDSAARAGQLVGAKLLVVGRVFTLGETTYLSARVIGTETSVMKPVLVEATAGRDGPPLERLAREAAQGVAKVIRDQSAALLPEPASDPLPALLDKARAAFGDEPPRVFVRVPERHFGRGGPGVDPAAQTELTALLRRAGCAIAPNEASADYVVDGEAFSEFGTRLGDLVSCGARVELRLDRRGGGEPQNLWAGRSLARAADLGEQTAGKLALELAARDAAADVLQAMAADAQAAE